MSHDCVVLGAGLSGMASALLLARHGRRVLLLEQAPVPGPLFRGFTRSGVHFDTGFHYAGGMGPGEPLNALLATLGVADGIRPLALDPEGFDLLVEPDGRTFPFPYGWERLRRALAGECPNDTAAIDAYLDAVRFVAGNFPYGNPGTRFEDDIPPRLPLTDRTLREFLQDLGASARLKRLLEAHAVLYGVPPDEAPFGIHACVVAGYYQSAWRIEGGGKSVVEAFGAALRSADVEILTGRRAEALRFASDGGLRGVEDAEGEFFPAPVVVSTLHPRAAASLVKEAGHLRPVYLRRLQTLEESGSALVLHALAEHPVERLGCANVILLGDGKLCVEKNPFDPEHAPLFLCGAFAPGEAAAAGFSMLCPASPSVADAWAESSRSHRPEGYRRFKEEARDRLLARLQTAYPDGTARARRAEVTTPLTLRDYTATPVGGLYGPKQKVGQHNPGPVTRVPGFYLAGQAIAAPGLFGALVSAFLACGQILGHNRLLEELDRAC